MSQESYNEINEQFIRRMDQLLLDMPRYVKDYIYDIEGRILPSTRYSYVFELKHFFDYLANANPLIEKASDVTLETLNALTIQDFNEYLHEVRKTIGEKAESRKVSAIRKFFTFLVDNHYIENKDGCVINLPKIHKKDLITVLEKDEITELLNSIIYGTYLTKKQLETHDKVKNRDVAIIALLVGTGMRVSECVGLNIEDIDMERNSCHIIRKGKKETNIYFSDSIKEYLETYYEWRKTQTFTTTALFVNREQTRLNARTIQRMMKKYCVPSICGSKTITPHKLRASYGSILLDEGVNLGIISEILGHESTDTTKAYYTRVKEESKERVGKMDLL